MTEIVVCVNIPSANEILVSPLHLGYTQKEWKLLPSDSKENILREIAMQMFEWGWYER